MTISDDYIIADFFSQRKNAIIEFVIKHPECTIKEVEMHCEKNYGSKKTVHKYIKQLETEGRLTRNHSLTDKRAWSLTVDSNNLLIYLQKDLQELFSRFQTFISVLKEWIATPENTFVKKFGKPEKKIDTQLITKKVSLLPYWLMDIINQIYTVFFIILLPKKINKKEHIRKLNALYHYYISQIYSLIYEELSSYSPILSENLSNAPLRYFALTDLTMRPIDILFRLINDSHAYSLQKELFDILNLVWERNIDIAYEEYGRYGDNSEFYCDKIDKSLLIECSPKLKVIYRGIANLMLTETNYVNRPSPNYYYEDDEFDRFWQSLTNPD